MEYLKKGSRSIEIPTNTKISETHANQHQVRPGGIDKEMDTMDDRPSMGIGPNPSPSQQNSECGAKLKQGGKQSQAQRVEH
jgi:hypothetical protein